MGVGKDGFIPSKLLALKPTPPFPKAAIWHWQKAVIITNGPKSCICKICTMLKQKAKRAAYIPPLSVSSTLWVVYKLIMQARH